MKVPDELDSRDLLVRQGDVLKRSGTGRWASPLSLSATDLITERLAAVSPDAWIVDRPEAQSPEYRLFIHVNRLDIMSDGAGVLEAEWQIVPRDASAETLRGRTRFVMNGSIARDAGVVRFERTLLNRLAGQIGASSLRRALSKSGAHTRILANQCNGGSYERPDDSVEDH